MGAMMLYNGTRLIDCHLVETYPNKYHLIPDAISNLKVADWDGLKKYAHRDVFKDDEVYVHIQNIFSDNDCYTFIIGFDKDTEEVTYSCKYNYGKSAYTFPEFYKVEYIHNQGEMELQAHMIKWLNNLIDNEILTY